MPVRPSISSADAGFAGLDLLSQTRPELTRIFRDAGEKPFRAEQLFRWLHVRLARELDQMTDLPAPLRERLRAAKPLRTLAISLTQQSAIDGSTRHLLRTNAGLSLETVVMTMDGGSVTQCLSSQVGCKMGCDFCATARLPVRANLTAGELVEQVAVACRMGFAAGQARGGVAGGEQGPLSARPHNLVFMGMGEPLDNLDAVIDALHILCDPKGYDFSPRRVTVSTSGLARHLPRLVAAHPHVNLAWSLTATTDAVRDRLMPVNKGVPIRRMVEALLALPPSQSRKLTFEYALLKDVNDSDEDARRLGNMALEVGAHVNVIPFNVWPGAPYQRPQRFVIRRFSDALRGTGASASLRESKGQDIGAACGQLAASEAAAE